MRIAFVNQPWDLFVPPVQRASIPIWTYQVASRLAHHCQVTVYSRLAPGLEPREKANGIRLRRVSTRSDELSLRVLEVRRRLVGCRPRRPIFGSPWYYLNYGLQIAQELSHEGCDVVHVHNFPQFVPVMRQHNPRARIALHMHCEWASQLDRRMTEPRLEQADWVIGCSQYITQRVAESYPRLASRCRAVYGGVDADCFTPPLDRPFSKPYRLLFVGRVSPEKGVHVLLKAYDRIVQSLPDVHLDIVGPASVPPPEFIIPLSDNPKVAALEPHFQDGYRARLQSLVPPDKQEQVRFLDHLPHQELAEHYRHADLVIVPSVWDEPFGLPVVEAMACGRPVVATRSGGIAELVEHGRTGMLVEPDDADALAEATLALLADEPLRRSMGQAARRRACERFSWDRIAADLMELYESQSPPARVASPPRQRRISLTV